LQMTKVLEALKLKHVHLPSSNHVYTPVQNSKYTDESTEILQTAYSIIPDLLLAWHNLKTDHFSQPCLPHHDIFLCQAVSLPTTHIITENSLKYYQASLTHSEHFFVHNPIKQAQGRPLKNNTLLSLPSLSNLETKTILAENKISHLFFPSWSECLFVTFICNSLPFIFVCFTSTPPSHFYGYIQVST